MIEGLEPYPQYKRAEMPWVAELPRHWAEKRAKYFFREVDERSEAGKEELLSVSHKTGVTPRSQKNVTMFKAESYAGHKLCRPNDLAINTMWAWMGALGVSRHTGIVSPAYGVYRPTRTDELMPAFVDALLRTPTYVAEFVCRSTGIRSSRLRLYPEQFLRIPLACPPPDEQAAIVRFIDYADRRIRRYIRAKQKLIKLLEEQKQAIIHQAVTRGLDPNVRFTPSGLEPLGDVPDHWEVRRLKFLTTATGGMTPSKADARYWCGDVPWVSPKDMKRRFINDSIDHISQAALDETGVRLVPPGAVLIVVRGMILARRFPTAVTMVPVTLNQDMKALRLSRGCRPEYFAYLFQGLEPHILSLAEEAGHGTRCLRTDSWENMALAVPPPNEQESIALNLDVELAEISSVQEHGRREIDLLHEYGTRLIADVVTGKLDVREAAAALPDELDDDEPELEETDDELDDAAELIDEESDA